ncbi:RICIN domain-containing protein [Micromonospora okii]|uniref:RICIN domain-containing protein n=1 Tax=Micromonospora okii TaxID=1182970 RepID=UPI001E2BCD37|nr:helix-turn-helix domain-containing protein [Micromonospora okii]
MDVFGDSLKSVRGEAEFVQLMRQLKDSSGYTFRQLEERAAASGDVLPRSTVADILRRETLPRPEVLAAFVRACAGPEHVDSWLAAHDRLAAAATGPVSPSGSASASQQPDPVPPAPTRPWLKHLRQGSGAPLAVAGLVALLAMAAWIARPDESPTPRPNTSGGAVTSTPAPRRLTLGAEESVAVIRPARTPKLCLSEGREHTRQFPDPVAVQRPCEGSTPPETILKSVGNDLYHIKWRHPQHGVGCLTVISGGPAADMLSPWSDCRVDRLSQLFRIEAVDTPVSGGFRLRPASADAFCIGIRGNELAPQAEALQEPCTGDGDQEFLVDISS